PMEIRHLLAQWIESQDWEAASNNEAMATILLQNLLIQVDEQLDRVSQEKNLLLIHNLKRTRKLLQGKYHGNPMHIAVIISNCLREERRILAAASMPVQGPLEKSLQNSVVSERQRNVEHKVSAIKNSAQMTDQDVKYLEDLQEEFDFRYKTIQSLEQSDKNSALIKQEMLALQAMLNTLDYKRKEVLSKIGRVIHEIDMLMSNMLTEELLDWKRRQQIACIGGPLHGGLDQLQNCFTLLAESLFQVRRQLEKLDELLTRLTYDGDPIPVQRPQLLEKVNFLLYNLFRNSFVVERQPCMPTHPQRPMVLKTLIQFTVKLRLLIKLPELNYQIRVKCNVLHSNRRFVLCGTHVKAMNMDESANGSLSVEFRHLQPKEMKSSAGSKGNEGPHMVTEELHSISFETQVCLYGLTINLETSSLPVVMISNVSQLPNAWASIIWYNLSTNDPQNLSFFNNPPAATLSQLLEVLSWQFSSYVGRGLNSEQLNMLAEKLMGKFVETYRFYLNRLQTWKLKDRAMAKRNKTWSKTKTEHSVAPTRPQTTLGKDSPGYHQQLLQKDTQTSSASCMLSPCTHPLASSSQCLSKPGWAMQFSSCMDVKQYLFQNFRETDSHFSLLLIGQQVSYSDYQLSWAKFCKVRL
uniref:Signal transducer and activator of transcription 4 n=1 Tax=Pavo cristatus TaxID=9049 RepID=A0A8C9ENS8_PAVCR